MNLLLADLHKFVGYSGGIEHVLSHMAFAMKEKGYHVSVVMRVTRPAVENLSMLEKE